MAASDADIAALLAEIRACRVCAEYLTAGPRPVVQLGAGARIVIIGQAPGSKVHASGVPWDDPSGDRLREWTGLTHEQFYDPRLVALAPMGFCYPGKGDGADLPPRRLTLLVGSYAQARYLPPALARGTMTQAVRTFAAHGTAVFPLPHPSWRSGGWMKKNPWFEADVVPALRARGLERLP